MLPARLLMILALVGLSAVCFLSPAAEKKAVFKDDFNRPDADTVGQGWTSRGEAVLKDKAAFFKLEEGEFRPRIRHTFPVQERGKFTVSFRMDWLRKAEGTWSFYMQLGNSAKIPRLLVYEKDLARGIGVNLVWGGGEPVDSGAPGSFGYYRQGEFKALFVVNDLKSENTIVREPVVTIEVDLDAGAYTVKFNGKTWPGIPFDNKGPIDTIRFLTNGCSSTGFSKSSIDDVTITR